MDQRTFKTLDFDSLISFTQHVKHLANQGNGPNPSTEPDHINGEIDRTANA
jgi:hypothetical protein